MAGGGAGSLALSLEFDTSHAALVGLDGLPGGVEVSIEPQKDGALVVLRSVMELAGAGALLGALRFDASRRSRPLALGIRSVRAGGVDLTPGNPDGGDLPDLEFAKRSLSVPLERSCDNGTTDI